MNQYLINYNEEPLDELVYKINNLNGLPLSEMKIKDLVINRFNGLPIKTGCGVYIFKNSDRTYYIGNCVSRNFVERIPAHFDIRHNGWFNSLLKAIIKDQNISIKGIDSKEIDSQLESSAEFAFDNLNLVLINFPNYNRDLINNIERLLAKEFKPINSRFKKLKAIL